MLEQSCIYFEAENLNGEGQVAWKDDDNGGKAEHRTVGAWVWWRPDTIFGGANFPTME